MLFFFFFCRSYVYAIAGAGKKCDVTRIAREPHQSGVATCVFFFGRILLKGVTLFVLCINTQKCFSLLCPFKKSRHWVGCIIFICYQLYPVWCHVNVAAEHTVVSISQLGIHSAAEVKYKAKMAEE